MNRRAKGTEQEIVAAQYLKEQGYVILEQNFRNHYGEIDIIAEDGKYICFVEVKYRKNSNCGQPVEAVNSRKQHIITKVAWYYLLTHGKNEWTPCRFDVIAIQGDDITLIKNAFDGFLM